MAPRSSWPTTWKEFLPISMPITAIAVCAVAGMACSLSWAPLASLSLAGQEHGRTIPLTDIEPDRLPRPTLTQAGATEAFQVVLPVRVLLDRYLVRDPGKRNIGLRA